jgi:hypothetical protein
MKKIRRWIGSPLAGANVAINYGLQGAKLDTHLNKPANRKLNNIPVINLRHVGNKYEAIKLADEAGVRVPNSVKPRDFRGENTDGWIMKPYWSLGGRNIERVKNLDDVPRRSHYMQKEVKNRRYELRCIAMAWVDPKDWLFQKRVHEGGEDILAWNHHNGGKFITVENPEEALFDRVRGDMIKLMKKFNYQFGAGDFLVQNPGERGAKLIHYFIEWNLAPGWTMERTEEWYNNHWRMLSDFSYEDVEAMTSGLMLNEIRDMGPMVQEAAQPNPYLRDMINRVNMPVDNEDYVYPEFMEMEEDDVEPEPPEWFENRLQDLNQEMEPRVEAAPADVKLRKIFCPYCTFTFNVETSPGMQNLSCVACGKPFSIHN